MCGCAARACSGASSNSASSIPFWISLLTRAFGWLALLSSRGLLNTWLQALGLVDEPLQLVRNEFGVVVGMVHVLIPFAVFPLASAMRSVDERVLLAAQRARGLAPPRLLERVPAHDASGIAGSALITFVFTLGFFVTPAILGGGRSVMVAELVYLRMFQSPDWGLGAADQRGAGRDRRRAHGARLPLRPAGPRREPAMTASRPGPLALVAASAVAVFLLLPLLAVVPISFTPARYLSMPHGTLSLIHYRELITNPDWLAAALLSLRIGVVTSLVSTALALAFSLGLWMLQPRFAGLMIGIVLLPMVVPPVVSAMTLYFLLTGLSRFGDLVGYDTWLGVTLAHVVMTVPFAVVLILVALAQVDRRIDIAARGLGASVWRRATGIILPNIRFGVMTAALLVFVLSWEEIGVTLFVTSVNAVTLPRLMWMGVHDNIDPAVAALSVVLIVVVTLALAGRLVFARSEPA